MKTGFKELDAAIDINGDKLIILGSRPAMGKSTLALNIISNIAIKQKEAVLYFNLESSKEQITSKFIVSNSMVEYSNVLAEIIIAKGLSTEKVVEVAWMPEYLKFGNLLRIR